jgi:hypothetical protein
MSDLSLYLESLRLSAILVRTFVGITTTVMIGISAMEGIVAYAIR